MKKEPSGPEDHAGADLSEPAPTDLRRHIWLLAVILAVVVLSWILSVASRTLTGPHPSERPAAVGRD